jgi:hypothetical protein
MFLRDQLASQPVIFSDATRRLFLERQRTARGTAIPMTLGWNVGTAGKLDYLYKEGGGGGFHSLMRLYLPQRIASVVMTNATGFDVNGFLNKFDPLCSAGRLN